MSCFFVLFCHFSHVLNNSSCYFTSLTGFCSLGVIVLGVLFLKYIVHSDSHFESSFKRDHLSVEMSVCSGL